MSVAMPTQRIGSEPFALLARIFNGLKRRGRVIDVLWFQQSADYARAVLALADECDDDAVREMGAQLRQMLGAYVAPPVVTVLAMPAAPAEPDGPADEAATDVPTSSPAAGAATAKDLQEVENRYVGRLR